MLATANTTAVTNNANATRPFSLPAANRGLTPNTSSTAAPITIRMPTPDSGLLEEPISPAM